MERVSKMGHLCDEEDAGEQYLFAQQEEALLQDLWTVIYEQDGVKALVHRLLESGRIQLAE
eukprot:6254766-Amphidinium_carterae.1